MRRRDPQGFLWLRAQSYLSSFTTHAANQRGRRALVYRPEEKRRNRETEIYKIGSLCVIAFHWRSLCLSPQCSLCCLNAQVGFRKKQGVLPVVLSAHAIPLKACHACCYSNGTCALFTNGHRKLWQLWLSCHLNAKCVSTGRIYFRTNVNPLAAMVPLASLNMRTLDRPSWCKTRLWFQGEW